MKLNVNKLTTGIPREIFFDLESIKLPDQDLCVCEKGAFLADSKFARDWWESYGFWHGIVSGFPLCCIIWHNYFFLNNNWYVDESYITKHHKFLKNPRIMCPDCLVRNLDHS